MSFRHLNLYYDNQTSDEVWKIIEDVRNLPENEVFAKYTIDNKEEFLKMLFEDYRTLVNEEAEHFSYGVDDYKEEYAQLKHFV